MIISLLYLLSCILTKIVLSLRHPGFIDFFSSSPNGKGRCRELTFNFLVTTSTVINLMNITNNSFSFTYFFLKLEQQPEYLSSNLKWCHQLVFMYGTCKLGNECMLWALKQRYETSQERQEWL